jgi:hypothetical protein
LFVYHFILLIIVNVHHPVNTKLMVCYRHHEDMEADC